MVTDNRNGEKKVAKLGRNDACWCGSGKKYKACHEEFDRKIEFYKNQGHIVPTHDRKDQRSLQGKC